MMTRVAIPLVVVSVALAGMATTPSQVDLGKPIWDH